MKMKTMRCSSWIILAVALATAMAPQSALCDPSAAPGASGDLRAMVQVLQDIRSQFRSRKWSESAGLFMKAKKSLAHSTPQLLTRVTPEELGHFSYALATLEEGFMQKDGDQVEQGYRLSRAALQELQKRFPSDLNLEIQDLRNAVIQSAACAARGDFATGQDYLEDVAGGRRRLDNAGMSYAKESWVHFGLTSEDLARAVRSKNVPAAQKAAAAASQDLDDLLDRLPAH